MICEFCGKRFKQESAFKNHHCKMMDKFASFDEGAFELWQSYLKGSKMYRPSDKLNQRMKFVKSPLFSEFLYLKRFLIEKEMGGDTAYPFFLGEQSIPKNAWRTKKTIGAFNIYRAKNENYALSVERSENYLKSRDLTLETCPKFILFTLLKQGLISKNIFISKNIDVKDVFTPDWLLELKGLV